MVLEDLTRYMVVEAVADDYELYADVEEDEGGDYVRYDDVVELIESMKNEYEAKIKELESKHSRDEKWLCNGNVDPLGPPDENQSGGMFG